MHDARIAVLERFIRENVLVDRTVSMNANTRLLSEGLMDSVGAVRLAAFVEESFGVRFDDSELRAGEIETIADILAAVEGRR